MGSLKQLHSILQYVMDSKLTPARLTLVHWIIIGIPVHWGIKPLWDSRMHSWMGARFLSRFSPASTMFNDRILKHGNFGTTLESTAVHNMGWLFIYPYELCIVAWFILRNSPQGMRNLHETLLLCSFATVVFMSILQGVHPRWSFSPFEPEFFARMVLCHMTAVSISAASIFWDKGILETSPSDRHQDWRAKSARWSIPGMALFVGAVVNSLYVVACLQTLMDEERFETYVTVDTDSDATQIYMTSFYFGLYYLAMHSFLLYRLRYNVMNVSQLKYICYYKFVLNLIVPLFWLPELDTTVHVNKRVTVGTRLFVTTVYWLGYHFAGLGDRVGRILVGEKADF